MATCLQVATRLKQKGMWDNTLFVWSSDNGGPQYWGANNYPLRGQGIFVLFLPVPDVIPVGYAYLRIALPRAAKAQVNARCSLIAHSLGIVLGGKGTDFEGGVRTAAFVSGGLLPPSVRGTVLHSMIHVCDWYRT